MRKKTKRAMTLLEIMIVIFIIGLISSVVGYNMRGSLDKGKAFKTHEAICKLYNVLQLELSEENVGNLAKDGLVKTVKVTLKNSGYITKPNDYLKDGWGDPLTFDIVNHEIRMTSKRYEEFCKEKNKPTFYPWEEEKDN